MGKPNGKHVKKDQRFLEHWQVITLLLIIYDSVTVNLAYFLALWFRFDCLYSKITGVYLAAWKNFIPIYILICIVCFWVLKLYRSLWRFASYKELIRVVMATVITCSLHTILITLVFCRMPISYYIVGPMFQFIFVLGIRFSYRFVLLMRNRNKEYKTKNVMLIGGGNAGTAIVRGLKASGRVEDNVVCIIDDNPNKWNRFIDDIPIIGGRDRILEAVNKYKIDKIYLAIPSASAEDKRDILNICSETDCELKNLPGIYQLVKGDISINAMRQVTVEDLLGRDPIEPDMTEVFRLIRGKTVLVTGGGGSIGSELCRQIAAHQPWQLIIFDVYENNAYEIQLELQSKYPDLNLVTLIGSVRDSRRLYEVFRKYKPNYVYHAAAHKHVPLMEDSPNEAIKNNVIGTYKTAYAAMLNGCERFVLISTDKAVNPTNIMGASKRMCEMVVQSFDRKIKEGKANEIPQLYTHAAIENVSGNTTEEAFRNIRTEFVAVRFGNVLGSNGSVIPIFKKQIEKGGPVTVTHPDIIRYFMTIPEAVRLVLLAGASARGGEIYILDMGEPVKIDTLARNLIRLSGLRPDIDIKIQYTGLRPGEKLYEEKLMAEEGVQRTNNKLIHIANPIPFDTELFLKQLKVLMDKTYANTNRTREYVESMVSTYHPVDNTKINRILEETMMISLVHHDDQ